VLESNTVFGPTIETWKRTSGTRDRPYEVAVIDVSSVADDGVVVVHDVFDKIAFTRKQTANENRIHITIKDIQVDDSVDWYLLILTIRRTPVIVFTHGSVAGLIGQTCVAVRGKNVREDLRFDIGTVLWEELSRHLGARIDQTPPPAGPRMSPPRPMRTRNASVQSFERMFDEMYDGLDSSFDPVNPAPNRANPANLPVVNQVVPLNQWPPVVPGNFSNCSNITFNFITKRCDD
jgi:hypothetical protein